MDTTKVRAAIETAKRLATANVPHIDECVCLYCSIIRHLNEALAVLPGPKKLEWTYACGVWESENYSIRVNEDGTYSWRIKDDNWPEWNPNALDLHESKQQCQAHANVQQPDGDEKARQMLRRVRAEIADTISSVDSCMTCRRKALEICDRELGVV